jgi:hypothetical protein
MAEWMETIIAAVGILAFLFFLLTRLQRRSKTVIQESIQASRESVQVSRERLQLERELLAVQKETNELLKRAISKLDTKT